MYIKANGKTFRCTNFSETHTKLVFEIEGTAKQLGGTVQLVTDDSFVLCTHIVSSFPKVNLLPDRIELVRVTEAGGETPPSSPSYAEEIATIKARTQAAEDALMFLIMNGGI